MLGYAADRRSHSLSPRALVAVLAGHAALLGVVLTARGEMPRIDPFEPTDIFFVEPLKPPPPPPEPAPPRSASRSRIETPPVIVPVPQPSGDVLDRTPAPLDLSPYAGNAVVPAPLPPVEQPRPVPVRKAAVFITPPDDVRPPYPDSKRRQEEGASLRLALSIDPNGRVVAVDAVGPADKVFLDAARRHILRRWRYRPAMEDGAAVAAKVMVTLTFEIE